MQGHRRSTHSTRRAPGAGIIDVGVEAGHIIHPSGFALGPNDLLAIADAPAYSRLQNFDADGRLIGWFYMAGQPGPRLALGGLALQGPGPIASTGRTFLFNAPATGSLISEFDARGDAVRGIGTLRPTGQESDPALHVALNSGLPLVDPTGGYYIVFETGVPMFRKYDAQGALRFERHIEGVEIDAALAVMPTRWPARPQDGSRPFAPSLVQTAAVDPQGRLWISLTAGYTYVYDQRGDKSRTVQFQASSLVSPVSLFFARGRRVLVTPGCYEFDQCLSPSQSSIGDQRLAKFNHRGYFRRICSRPGNQASALNAARLQHHTARPRQPRSGTR
jgi:hypothetical protein